MRNARQHLITAACATYNKLIIAGADTDGCLLGFFGSRLNQGSSLRWKLNAGLKETNLLVDLIFKNEPGWHLQATFTWCVIKYNRVQIIYSIPFSSFNWHLLIVKSHLCLNTDEPVYSRQTNNTEWFNLYIALCPESTKRETINTLFWFI